LFRTLRQATRLPFLLSGITLMKYTFIALIFLVTCTVSGQVRTGPKWAPTNFDTTVSGNFRGAKITKKAQVDSMKSVYGITTIINLAKDALPKKGKTEIDWAKEAGIEYISVYLGTSPPSKKKWEMIKQKLDGGKVYVHCAHGADRTGAVIARYRLDNKQCSPAQAYKESRRYGFKPWLKEFRKWMKYPKQK
jgi:Dual specificity phosphatase, catalytic domain